MTSTDFNRLLDNSSLLSEDTLPELKQLVDVYPYFHTARMLYLKNLVILNDIRFSSELKRMSVYIPDRRKLFMLIEGEQYNLQASQTISKIPEKEDAFSLIDAFLSSNKRDNEQNAETTLLFQPSVSSDYIFWSLTKGDEETLKETLVTHEEVPEAKLQHHDLIDSFIKQEEQRMPGSGFMMDDNAVEAEPPTSVKESEGSHVKPLDDSFFTETLARIYIKQKRYEKALQIIKNLNLKYPEKNVYFADQIRFLEKLIINTKK